LLAFEALQRRIERAGLVGAAGEKKNSERAHGSATEQMSGRSRRRCDPRGCVASRAPNDLDGAHS
jgi:hypothetical protein